MTQFKAFVGISILIIYLISLAPACKTAETNSPTTSDPTPTLTSFQAAVLSIEKFVAEINQWHAAKIPQVVETFDVKADIETSTIELWKDGVKVSKRCWMVDNNNVQYISFEVDIEIITDSGYHYTGLTEVKFNFVKDGWMLSELMYDGNYLKENNAWLVTK